MTTATAIRPLQAGPAPAPPAPAPQAATPAPVDTVELPRDEGAHPGVKTEWWYLNGHLRDAEGNRYGFHHALFDAPDVMNARFNVDLPGAPGATALDTALLDESTGRHSHTRSYTLIPPGQPHPGIQEGRLDQQFQEANGTWRLKRWDSGLIQVVGPTGQGHLDLLLEPEKPPLLMGGDGEIPMGPHGRSKYYTLPRMRAHGLLTLDGRSRVVEGTAWLDHQWGDMQMFNGYDGWDWFGIQLDDRTEINAFRFRGEDGGNVAASVGISRPDGSQEVADDLVLTPGDTWTSDRTGITYPLEWHLSIPSKGTQLTLRPAVEAQEVVGQRPFSAPKTAPMPTYWEGQTDVSGTIDGRPVSGQAYVELVGYAAPWPVQYETVTVGGSTGP